ncbi:response regulator transcription factor [Lagierella massiliensis]|uniref:response regulator transcription factor n=1 Tax=Lagierella massiliensis TaxID=1689303 RepID=UPI0006D808A3|nr:helix-turn-helix domain-containing protein [Lagierella massiliensis]
MLRCAIIDDEKSVHKIINNIIEKDGLPLIISNSAYDGIEGKSLIKKNNFDIIFIDIQMPYLDGFDLISKYPNNNYIVVTAFDYFDYAQKALRLGVKDILLKPIDREQLAEAVNRAIGFKLTKNKVIDEVLLYIHSNYSREISVGDLAEQNYMNSSNFSRLFKNCVGVSIIDYLRKIRINKAKDLLDSSYKSISEIALEVGYKSENLFYKDFKRIENITPSKYREKGI